MIETRNLTKIYGDFYAVTELNMQIDEGDVFGFIGPNGSGKTTSIRMLATLLNPTSGEAYVGGHSIYTDAKKIRRMIGYMPDFFGVYDDMKVIEYLEFFAAAYRVPANRRRAICEEKLEMVDLTFKRDAQANALSRGQTQRLGLARVMLHEPKVMLLDEPASGLDPAARIEIRALLKRLGELGKTVLVSSHILPELADVCNKIGIIFKSKLLEFGEVREVIRRVKQAIVLNVGVVDRQDDARSLIESHDAVQKIIEKDGHFQVTLKQEDTDYSWLAASLTEKGHRIKLFSEEEVNLEDVFMTLTRGEMY